MPITVMDFLPVPPPGCTCGQLSCVCNVISNHHPECKFRRATAGSVPIECDHGRDVCPICDPCTCAEHTSPTVIVEEPG